MPMCCSAHAVIGQAYGAKISWRWLKVQEGWNGMKNCCFAEGKNFIFLDQVDNTKPKYIRRDAFKYSKDHYSVKGIAVLIVGLHRRR